VQKKKFYSIAAVISTHTGRLLFHNSTPAPLHLSHTHSKISHTTF